MRSSSAILFLCVLVSGASPIVPAATASGTQVLARWQGGELTRERFLQLNPDGEALLEEGGRTLLVGICKGAFVDVYYRLAESAGLDRDPGVAEEVAAWEQRRLAQLYRERHRPDAAASLTQASVRAYYERQIAEFTQGPVVDLDVLFVRCPLEDETRNGCRGRMEELQARVAAGVEMGELLAEERQRSGAANASFDKIDPEVLFSGLKDAVSATPPGSFTPVVESLDGFFWVRVKAIQPARPLPLARAERKIRRTLLAEFDANWRRREVERLRGLTGAARGDAPNEEELFAAAARGEGLDEDPGYLSRRDYYRRFKVADAAFFQDAEILPSDEQLAGTLRSARGISRYREDRFLLAVVDHSAGIPQALGTIRAIQTGLGEGMDPAAFLRGLTSEHPTVSIREIGPLTAAELRRAEPALVERAESLEAGQWVGPFPHRSGPSRGTAFLLLESRRTPPLAEVRQALLRDSRGRLGASPESFLSTFGPRWGFEVLVDTGSMRPAEAAEQEVAEDP